MNSFSFEMGPTLNIIKERMQISCQTLVGKLYFRRGTAYASDSIRNFDEAIDDLENAKEFNSSTSAQCEKAIKEITARKNVAVKQEAKRIRRAFST